VPLQERQLLKALFDPLVGVAEAFFQPQYFFPHHGKPEMTGFDDAGVDRTHCNFVYPITFDPNEGIVIKGRALRGGCRQNFRHGICRCRQWKTRGPRRMAEPGAGVGVAGIQSHQIAHRTLHARCSRKHRLQAGISALCGGEREGEYDDTRSGGHGGEDGAIQGVLFRP